MEIATTDAAGPARRVNRAVPNQIARSTEPGVTVDAGKRRHLWVLLPLVSFQFRETHETRTAREAVVRVQALVEHLMRFDGGESPEVLATERTHPVCVVIRNVILETTVTTIDRVPQRMKGRHQELRTGRDIRRSAEIQL